MSYGVAALPAAPGLVPSRPEEHENQPVDLQKGTASRCTAVTGLDRDFVAGQEQPTLSGPEQDRSLFSRMGSWWTPAAGVREHAIESLESSLPSMSEPHGPSRLPTDTSPAGSLEDADATWEPVDGPAGHSHTDFAHISSMFSTPRSIGDVASGQGAPAGRPQSPRRSLAFDAAVDLLRWSRQSLLGDPASDLDACHRLTADMAAGGPKLSVSADSVQAVLLWEDSWRSSKVFAVGLYALICLRALVLGNPILQPTSALAAALLCALLCNHCRRFWMGSRPFTAQGEAQLQQLLANRLAAVTLAAAPTLSAVVMLIIRCLSGSEGLGASVWLGLALWSTACLGELHLLSQPGMLLLLWVAAFALPPFYVACRFVLDSFVEEAVQFVADLVQGGQRSTIYTAAGLGVVAFVMMGGKVLLRISIAGAIAFAFLAWKFWLLRAQQKSERPDQGPQDERENKS